MSYFGSQKHKMTPMDKDFSGMEARKDKISLSAIVCPVLIVA